MIIINVILSSYVKSKIFEDIIDYFKKYSQYRIIVTRDPIEKAHIYFYFRPHLTKKLKEDSIITVHHDLNEDDPNLDLNIFIDRYKEAKLIICLNSKQKEILEKHNIFNTIIIPHGYNHQVLEKKRILRKDKLTLGFISSYYPRLVKGEDYLIKLFSNLSSKKFKFILVGKNRNLLAKQLINLGFECIVMENLPYFMFNKLYSNIDYLLITSKFEGGPACVPEALYTNTPIISTQVGMIDDFNSILINKLTFNLEKDLKIINSIQQKSYLNLKKIDNLYTWEQVIKKYDGLFELYSKEITSLSFKDWFNVYLQQFIYYKNTIYLKKKIKNFFLSIIDILKLFNYNRKNFSISKKLIKNSHDFLDIKYYSFLNNLLSKKGTFYGWGRKKSGQKAMKLAKKYNTSYVLLEDGFIRSLDLGIKGSPSFSIVEDDIGIYYDATTPSRLENMLLTYDFTSDPKLMKKTKEAIEFIKKYHISKYNHATDISENYFLSDEKRVLIIAQTAGDSSLEYGLGNNFTTHEIINAAIKENPDSKIYLKIHPDVLCGKKKSDINIKDIDESIIILSEDVNPISLLKHFSKVYTKTSGMGFEALIIGCECICFGMPFYAGWGITDDRILCDRRTRKLSVEEVFAAVYILYTRYVNPYTKKEIDIIETIETISKMK